MEEERERGGRKKWKREEEREGRWPQGGGESGRGARVREERVASRPSDVNQWPKTHSLNRAPDPSERMPKKDLLFL
jgi:hypothetical protein